MCQLPPQNGKISMHFNTLLNKCNHIFYVELTTVIKVMNFKYISFLIAYKSGLGPVLLYFLPRGYEKGSYKHKLDILQYTLTGISFINLYKPDFLDVSYITLQCCSKIMFKLWKIHAENE